jgi:hypothetical protein
VVQGARQVVEQTQGLGGIDVLAGLVIDQLRQETTFYCDLADRVMDQTRRRVLLGETVPPALRLVAIPPSQQFPQEDSTWVGQTLTQLYRPSKRPPYASSIGVVSDGTSRTSALMNCQ